MNEQNNALLQEPPSDKVEIRCPRLGHQISFSYCRNESRELPCFKTLDCWYSHFDVHTFFKTQLSGDEFEKAFQKKTKPKVASLFELIEQAKGNQL